MLAYAYSEDPGPALDEPHIADDPPLVENPVAFLSRGGAPAGPARMRNRANLEMLSCEKEATILMKTKDRAQKTKPKRTMNKLPTRPSTC